MFSKSYSGIEPVPCDVFSWKFPFWNWTTFFLAKQLFWPKRTHGYLICSSPSSSFSFMWCFLRTGVSLLALSCFSFDHFQRIEPVDLEQKLFGIPFWNWTYWLRCFFWNFSILELNHFFTHKTPLLTKNHTRLPNMLHPLLLFSFVFFFRTGIHL